MAFTFDVSPSLVWYILLGALALVLVRAKLFIGEGFKIKDQKNFVKNIAPKLIPSRGPVFRIRAFGKRYVFVCDAAAINAIKMPSLRHQFSQPALRHKINLDANIMGVPKTAALAAHDVSETISKLHMTYLGGAHASEIATQFHRHIQEYSDLLSPVEDGKTDITAWCVKVTFYCSARALFGDTFPVEDAHPHFVPFDNGFTLLTRRMAFFAPEAVLSREVLVTLLSAHLRYNLDECSTVVKEIYATLSSDRYGLSHEDICRSMIVLLWGSNVNSVWLHSFALMLTNSKPEVLAQVRKEMDAATANGGQLSYHLDATDFSSVPTVSHIVDETLRWGGANMSYRMVTSDTLVPLRNGGAYQFLENDTAIMVSWLMHHDREHWTKPSEWSPLENMPAHEAKEKTAKPGDLNFFLPWGMGQSICPGRKVAAAETRLFVANFLEKFDVHLDPKDELPRQDWSKNGLGFTPPTRNWAARVTRRQPVA